MSPVITSNETFNNQDIWYKGVNSACPEVFLKLLKSLDFTTCYLYKRAKKWSKMTNFKLPVIYNKYNIQQS